MPFDNFPEQFANPVPRSRKGQPAGSCRTVDLAAGFAVSQFRRTDIPLFLQTMQDRIERAGAYLVAMTPKLFEHSQAENRLLASVMENVEANQPRIELAIIS